MSLTSKSVVIPLKAIEMSQLREYLESELKKQYLSTELESMNDSELLLKISNNPYKTMATITRHRHRPLEVTVDVDFSKAQVPKQVKRETKSNRNSAGSGFSYRWIWLLLIFGGFILSLLSSVAQILENAIDSLGINENLVIGIMMLVFVTVPIIVIYGIPAIQKRINESRRLFDGLILERLQTCIELLHQELTATDVLRCWSCFEEVEFEDKVCAACGVSQKP